MRANMDQHLSMVPQIKNVRLLLPLYLRLWAHVVQSDCHVFMKAFVWLTIYLSLGLPHFYMLRHFGKRSHKSCCSTSVTEYGVQYWVIGIDESICMWLLDNRGYILHFFFSSLYIFYLHWFVALALHMCNKYSVLYFCAFCCILCTNVASFTVFWQFLFNYVPLNVKSSIWVYIFEFLVCGNINP